LVVLNMEKLGLDRWKCAVCHKEFFNDCKCPPTHSASELVAVADEPEPVPCSPAPVILKAAKAKGVD
jgi:hypothetical protein